jgi:DNA-binding helix-hairpin-helix protein with protein kinase domain
MEFAKGTILKTVTLNTVKVGEKLGEGGQGAVYRVSCCGRPKALKWYSSLSKKLRNPGKFRENLENNIKRGAPTESFLWPQDIVTGINGFGYIMDLKPPEYREFSRFLLAKEKFSSVTAMVNAALYIVEAFRELHNKGYSYQDLNDGNFFVHPKTGEVLICDNDNVAEYGKNLGIGGKCRYIAPEIVMGKAVPSVHSDKYSLSVMLFLLLLNNHPLEGKKAYPPCMTEELERKLYGEEPLFIFDPKDTSNSPVPGINNNAIVRWPLYPSYVREKFINAFSNNALQDPSFRIIEKEWLKTFIRLRSEIFKCSCGEVFFADPVTSSKCPACQKEQVFNSYICTPKYNIAIHQRTKLYACHTEGESDDFSALSAETILNPDGILELKNRSKKTWLVLDRSGKQQSRGPGKTISLDKGSTIIFGSVTAQVL